MVKLVEFVLIQLGWLGPTVDTADLGIVVVTTRFTSRRGLNLKDRLRCKACSTIIQPLPPSRIVICMNIWNNGTSSLVMALVL